MAFISIIKFVVSYYPIIIFCYLITIFDSFHYLLHPCLNDIIVYINQKNTHCFVVAIILKNVQFPKWLKTCQQSAFSWQQKNKLQLHTKGVVNLKICLSGWSTGWKATTKAPMLQFYYSSWNKGAWFLAKIAQLYKFSSLDWTSTLEPNPKHF